VQVIVIDDGSTDGTWDWLQSQRSIVAIRQDNWGKDNAANHGFARSTGEFIRFLDSDDWVLPDANDRQLEIGRQTGADIVVSGHKVHDHNTGREDSYHWPESDDFLAQQLGESGSGHYSSYLFRRSFISNIPHRQEFGAVDDRMFVIECAILEPKVAIDPGLAIVHRHHDSPRLQVGRGLHSSVTQWHHLQVYRKAFSLLESHGQMTPRRKKAIARLMWDNAHRIAFAFPRDGADVANWVYSLDPEFKVPNAGALGALYRTLGFTNTERILRMRRLIRAVLRTHIFPRIT
jgi:glycosyltransferase involved in cell wall biosynthesis